MTRSERLGLEPGSVKPISNERPVDGEIAHSIAISLKRIADVFERSEKQLAGDRP